MTFHDAELPIVREIATSRPLARVSHTCTICGCPIAIGQRYERILYRDLTALNQSRSLRTVKLHEIGRCPATESSNG